MRFIKAAAVGAALTILWAAGATAAAAEPSTAVHPRAFATIGGTRYHPFYTRVISPHAFVVKETVLCAFQNSRGRPILMAYATGERKWSGGPHRASSFGLGGDAHGNPSLYVDRKGYVHVFYGCHGREMRHARSARPHDLRRWQEQPPPAPRATYPQSFRLADGRLYLFYRAGGHPEPWTLRTSGDDGASWSEPQRILEMRIEPRHPRAAAYAHFFPGRGGRTVHCFWNYKEDDRSRWPEQYRGLHEAVYRFNIYYVGRDAKGAWRNAAGKAVSLPVSKAEADAACLVYDSGDVFAYPGAHGADARDRPYLAFRTGVRDWKKPNAEPLVPTKKHFACFRGGGWKVTDAMPSDWPEEVARLVRGGWSAAHEAKAHGGTGLRYEGPWFIGYRHRPRPTAVFLRDAEGRYAVREGGPARCE